MLRYPLILLLIITATTLSVPENAREGFSLANTSRLKPLEARLIQTIRPENCRSQHRIFTEKPHMAGSVRNYELAQHVAKQWKDPVISDLLGDARDALAATSDWTAGPLEEALRGVADRRGLGAGKLFQPLRVALTGSSISPGIFDVLMLLGRDRSLARIDTALRELAR